MTKIKMTASITSDYPVGSTATIIYIDEMDNVFVEWSDGKLSSFSDKQILNSFERIGAKKKRSRHYVGCVLNFKNGVTEL